MHAWLLEHWRHLGDPSEYSCPLYLLSAFGVAVAYLTLGRGLAPRAACARVLARAVWTSRSARADYAVFAINELLFRVPNAAAFAVIVAAASRVPGSLVRLAVPLADAAAPAWLAGLLLTAYLLAALDLGSYVTHKMQHDLPFFWRFHAVHHSAEVMHPLTVFRQHPLDMAHYTLVRGVFAGLAVGSFRLVFPAATSTLQLAGVNAGLFLYYLFAGLRHSHVPFAYPRWLRGLFFSPHLHQLHHSSDPRHSRRNYGVIFAVWDRLFKTYLDEPVPDQLRYGLGAAGTDADHSLLAMYFGPLGVQFRATRLGRPSGAKSPNAPQPPRLLPVDWSSPAS